MNHPLPPHQDAAIYPHNAHDDAPTRPDDETSALPGISPEQLRAAMRVIEAEVTKVQARHKPPQA